MIINILTATGTQSIWKAERTIFYGKSSQEFSHPFNVWTDLHGSNAEPLATYTPNGENEAYVDMTDYIRAYPNVGHVYFYNQTYFEDIIDIQVTVAGLINPAKVYHPSPGMPFCEVLPPERILWNPSNFGGSVISECYIKDFFSSWTVDGGSWVDSTTKRQIQASGDFTITWQNVSRKSTFYGFFDNPCEDADAVVRWLSFSGVQRKHYFKVRKSTITPQGAYQLLTMDNSYNEIKGREDSVTLVIDELSAYDLWYYADIITSSKVELLLRDVDGWSQVQVTNKNVTIPDGEGRNGKLEITVNWRRYDAVTM